ncbi:MAG: hypothetical protein COZ37_04795 [bacterium (Candidatus Ratteibacteria) CG_4_10_14_3_um_filter_41_18]|uniref:Lipid A biosynthesis acyltransferase n=4 Tax=Candidatus Ratteibacteria TaxID=2979319 RepID=A0A2M7E761_9BACT|nr:MAG: hypothetical protein AUJ76_04690 [Candidatus Omnitrophica bacterium CG1_02_41_171]PIV63553.1 MAG: hypothetical protein COS11_06830 [bacterium (Candidatus Ratteibacteria) CG01_land_8_20_14_3_00_40_19]PIW31460.1 MAG: hypothetical protein COW28_07180 [bacterium (Candidatus Ratteibacteria) CG15_BIG_FIL_POST_REV_8_21_14_020_41_12]PIX77031.1 MAG: hypothetical protein COZ37_04795 [bacterium (Candidatus Ratteibacteria) CG_4_10_14_3_um_filter_41_18]PJA61136.1 MAG: hypothetical protein CO162_0790
MIFLFHFYCFLGLHLPLRLSYFIARRIADFYYLFARRRREGVESNIRQVLAFQSQGSANRFLVKRYAKEAFYNFARYILEFCYLPKINRSNFEKFVAIKGKEYLDQAFAQGKGVVSITAHLGNWELGGAIAGLLGYPMNAVALSHKKPGINKMFIERREGQGVKIISLEKGLKKIIRVLKNNEIIALLGDRLIGDKGIEMEFFGRKTKLPQGPAALALKLGCPIVPGFLVRIKEGKLLLVFEPPILPTVTGNKEKDLEELAQRALKIVEKYISAYPSQWLIFQPIW